MHARTHTHIHIIHAHTHTHRAYADTQTNTHKHYTQAARQLNNPQGQGAQSAPAPLDPTKSELKCSHFGSCSGCSIEVGLVEPPVVVQAKDYMARRLNADFKVPCPPVLYMCVFIYACVCMCVDIYIYIYACIYIYIYIYIYICKQICICSCMLSRCYRYMHIVRTDSTECVGCEHAMHT
jgi:hypothetical protein